MYCHKISTYTGSWELCAKIIHNYHLADSGLGWQEVGRPHGQTSLATGSPERTRSTSRNRVITASAAVLRQEL